MRRVEKFIAEDGTEFTTEGECVQHEKESASSNEWRSLLEDFQKTLPSQGSSMEDDPRSERDQFDDWMDRLVEFFVARQALADDNPAIITCISRELQHIGPPLSLKICKGMADAVAAGKITNLRIHP